MCKSNKNSNNYLEDENIEEEEVEAENLNLELFHFKESVEICDVNNLKTNDYFSNEKKKNRK